MLRGVRKFADEKKINLIVTGEVEGQRPMSQTKKSLRVIEKEAGLKNSLLRIFSELGISGRRRDKQIALAKKFGITYPSPAGGCLLCEKGLKKRLGVLVKKELINDKTLKLINIGRHFWKNNCWFVVARNRNECKIIEMFKGNFIEGERGKPSVYYSKRKERNFAKELQDDFKTGGGKRFAGGRL